MDYIAEAITAHYGERCPDFDGECACCSAWAQYDSLSAAPVAVKTDNQWHVAYGQHSTLIYSLMEDGWRKGEPVMINDVMIRVEKSHKSQTEIQPIIEAIMSALSAAPVSEPEPVAWMFEWKPRTNNNPWEVDVSLRDPRTSLKRELRNVRPLFTVPPSAERMREALEWYGDNASATKRHLEGRVNDETILAIITTLALDGGKRALAALAEKGGAA